VSIAEFNGFVRMAMEATGVGGQGGESHRTPVETMRRLLRGDHLSCEEMDGVRRLLSESRMLGVLVLGSCQAAGLEGGLGAPT